jgi:pyridoxamine 5'-phosphate oxidase
MSDDPIDLFRALYDEAAQSCVEPDAMVLSTVDADGRPSSRYVLLKAIDRGGFVFYTNLTSRKASALAAHPYAALCFYWAGIGKQIRVEGAVDRVTDAEADAYFATRPQDSQIGAWASDQSSTLESRAELDRRVQDVCARFAGGRVPRPPFWSGYRVVPDAMEFWTRDPARLHERERFERDGDHWIRRLLYP